MRWRCPTDATSLSSPGWHLALPAARARGVFAPFLRDYTAIRDAEGYGYDDLARLQRLPDVDPADPLAWQWRMRAISFASLRRHVLAPMDQSAAIHEGTTKTHEDEINTSILRAPFVALRRIASSLRVLDLGAGVGWLSNRLAGWGTIPARSI